ncbi:hypothetical protein [Pseudomonas koreensis]|uniref:Uncharacterized protein n=1 Tax=Pseudomonas koreensis TaxID=198620 RepID=A0A9X2XSD6_9PSED|nr:hypothetical protein [Pseudomonas koreensis]MCU7251684.1 hypothetical protein [Pseudomonas koreensis]
MEFATIVQLLTVMGIVAAATKVIRELLFMGKSRLTEEYRVARDVLKDMEQNPNQHPLVVERGYFAIAGTSAINPADVAYLISLVDPAKSLKDYVLSRQYVELDARRHRIDFRPKYKSSFSRIWRKTWYGTMYVVWWLIAMAPLLLIQPLSLEPKFALWMGITLPVAGFFGVSSLIDCLKISRSEKLVKSQEQHTPRILVSRESKKSTITPTKNPS